MILAPATPTPLPPALKPLAADINYQAGQRSPGVFVRYQGKWVSDRAKVKIVEKSRRIGLSWAESEDAVECAVSAKGMDVWYIGYTKDMAIEFILDCAQWAQQLQGFAADIEAGEEIFVDGDERQSILKFSITFASGFRITALSSTPRNLRGKQGRVIIDEAAFHNDLAGLIKAAMALLMWGGEVRIISTHDGDENAFNQLIKDVRAGRLPYSVHRITFEDAMADGLYTRVCMRTGTVWTAEGEAKWAADIRAFYGDDAEEELDCVPKNGSGAFLPRDLIERSMRQGWPILRDQRKPAFTFVPEPARKGEIFEWCEEYVRPQLEILRQLHDVTSFVGGDFARISDLTAYAPLIQFRSMRLRIPFLLELRGMPFQQQRQVLWYLMDGLPRFSGAALDSRGLGMQISEETAQRYGPKRILLIQATRQWYLEHLPPFKAAFEDTRIELPYDADVIADYRVPRVIKGIPQIPDLRTEDAEKKKRHGDTFIAGALAHHASRQLLGTSIYEYESAPPKSVAWDGPRRDHDEDQELGARRGAW
jgi:phage FluMu gp28-like protein